MNGYFVAAAALAFLVGLVHSVLGERLIFRRLRQGGWVPTNGGSALGERQVRILWATWHIATVFGWCTAAMLLRWARPLVGTSLDGYGVQVFMLAMLSASALVFIGTQARHPGWLGLLGIAVLVWLGRGG